MSESKSQFNRKTSIIVWACLMACLITTGIGCDNSDTDSGATSEPERHYLTGTVTGKPAQDSVTIRGASGNTTTAAIGTNGEYKADVTTLTPPYLAWAEGLETEASVMFYSARFDNGTLNITNVTDFAMALALGQSPAEYYAANPDAPVPDSSSLNAAKTKTRELLKSFFTAAGVTPDFDPFTSPFAADGTGFDRLSNVLAFSVDADTATMIETMTNQIIYRKNLKTGETLIETPAADIEHLAMYQLKPLYRFPGDFIWGTATAAHQVESDNTNNDWYVWEELGRIKDGHSNLTGPDHWNNYELDFDIAKNALNTNAYRMSIEWSKVEPEMGRYDQSVIDHYHRMLDALIARGIKPVVTFQHFTLPRWIHDPAPDPANGNAPANPGWNDPSEDPLIIERLVKFTKDMAAEFGGKVDWWITINEPLVMYSNGYLIADFPPGVGYKNEPGALAMDFPTGHHGSVKENLPEIYKTGDYGLRAGIQAATTIIPNMVKAHVMMYDAVKESDAVDADGDGKASMISISKHHVVFRPFGNDDAAMEGYEQIDYLWNRMFWDAILLGQLDKDMDMTADEDLTKTYGAFPKADYIGFNFYSRRDVVPVSIVSAMIGVPVEDFLFFKGFPIDTSVTGGMFPDYLGKNYNCLGWEIYPEGMKEIIRFYSENYAGPQNLPIMITENGTDNDADRPGFVVDMIEQMGEAMSEGHNVIGYLHWSLMDNFEWERGYGQHFGLVRVDFDYENKQSNRVVNEGGQVYNEIIRRGGVVQAIKDHYGTIDNPDNIRDDAEACRESGEHGGDEDDGPLATVPLGSSGMSVTLERNGTFILSDGEEPLLKNVGEGERQGAAAWRNAEVTAVLPLSGTIQGGFLGHENFETQTETEAPWTTASKADAYTETENGVTAKIHSETTNDQASISIETASIEGVSAPVVKVTVKGPAGNNFIAQSFQASPDERFYGFGNPVWTTQHRGQEVHIWVTEQLLGRVTPEDPRNFTALRGNPYDNQIPVPFFMSSEGYAVLLDSTYRSSFEMCTEDHPDTWRMEVWNNEMSYFVIRGDNYKALLADFSAIAGRPSMPPDWFFSPMNDAVRGEDNVLRVARLIRDNDIPSSVIWTEDWIGIGSQETGFRLSHDWDYSPLEYPNIESMIDSLHNQAFKFLGYFSPFLPNPETTPGHNEEKWAAALANGYYFKNPEGRMREMVVPPLITPPGGGLDVTNPDAVEWYKNYVYEAARIGLDGAMVDFGEWVPYDSVFSNGKTAPEVHNQYPVMWQKINREAWNKMVGDGVKEDFLFYARSGYTGVQKYAPAIWAGDQNTNFDRLDGMASVITMGLNLGMSGVSFFGHDIGGYSAFDTPQLMDVPAFAALLPPDIQSEVWDGVSTKELFLRWTAIAAYSPMMRTHHGSKYGQNWSFEGGPNPNNFKITQDTIDQAAASLDTIRDILSPEAAEALAVVEGVFGSLAGRSFGTWVDIDTAVRVSAGDNSIDTLKNANIYIAKLLIKYADSSFESLSRPRQDAETMSIYKRFAQDHITLFPYMKAIALESVDSGVPMMRHMILEYPDDPAVRNGIPDNAEFRRFSGEKSGIRPYNEMFQYFFGGNLLVAPIIREGSTSRPVYLPEGEWINVYTHERFTGPATITANAQIDEIPVYAPAGAIIPKLKDTVESLVETNQEGVIDYMDVKDQMVVDVYLGKSGSFETADGVLFEFTHWSMIESSNQKQTATVNGEPSSNVWTVSNVTTIPTNLQSGDIHVQLNVDDAPAAELFISGTSLDRDYTVRFIH